MSVDPFVGDSIKISDLGRFLEQAAQTFQKVPLSFLQVADEYSIESVDRIHKHIKSSLERLYDYQTQLESIEQKSVELSDEAFSKVRELHTKLQKKFDDMPELKLGFTPYQFESFVKIANSIAMIDDRTWERLLKIFELWSLGNKTEA